MRPQSLRGRLREATGNAILDALESLAAEKGIASPSLQAIAQRAGVAVGTIYNYFSDKDRLVEAMFARRREELFGAIDRAAKENLDKPFAVQLAAFVTAVFAHFDAHREFLRIALEAEPGRAKVIRGNDGRKRPAMQQLHDRAARVVAIGIREKRLSEEDAGLLAIVLTSIVRGVLIDTSQTEQRLLDRTERVVSLFLDGAAR
jgi:AcrR family transcriptional regulator